MKSAGPPVIVEAVGAAARARRAAMQACRDRVGGHDRHPPGRLKRQRGFHRSLLVQREMFIALALLPLKVRNSK